MEFTTALEKYVLDGGVMMIFLIPALFLMIAFAIQGFLNMRRKRIVPRGFTGDLLAARRQGGRPAALKLIESESHSMALVLRNVIAHLDFKPDADAAEVLREQIEDECDGLSFQISPLTAIYTVSPLMGLLGTVFGLIQTFNEYTTATNPDLQRLSEGVNVALLTTAWGLSIAIPAYVAQYLLRVRLSNYEQVVLQQEGTECLHILLDREPAETPEGTGKLTVRDETAEEG